MNEELINATMEYAEEFDDNFPTFLFTDYTIPELVNLIHQCILQHKTAEEITHRHYDKNVDY